MSSWLSSMLGSRRTQTERPASIEGNRTPGPSITDPPTSYPTSYRFEHAGRHIVFECPSEISLLRAKGVLIKEPGTIAWIDGFEPGASFWDIGANIGMFSLYAAVYREARVTAFEPAAPSYVTLARNIAANRLDRTCRALPCAIDDRCHVADMRMRDDVPGSALHMFGTDTDYTGATIEATYFQGAIGVSVDALCSVFGLAPPDYIKVDVDGLERAVVAGARQTLTHCRSALVELDLNDAAEVAEITETMQACGLHRDDSVPGNQPRPHPSALVYNMVFRR